MIRIYLLFCLLLGVPSTLVYAQDIDTETEALVVYDEYFWSNGSEIGVWFVNGPDDLHKKVIDTANIWSNYANIRFTESDINSPIHIEFNTLNIHNSAIGTYAKEESGVTMRLGLSLASSESRFKRVVLHEFGHALGLTHEQFHTDANIPWNIPEVYDYFLRTHNWDKNKVDNNVLNIKGTPFGNFDSKSIMQYQVPNHLTIGDFEIPFNSDLSENDKKMIALIYPKPNQTPANRIVWQSRLASSNGFEYQGPNAWETSTGTQSAQGVGLGDVDGDGDDDLILQYEHNGLTKWQARLSDGSRFVYQNGAWETSTGTQFNANAIGIADVNNDGYDDLVLQYEHDGLIKWQARLSDPDGSRFIFQNEAWQTSTSTQSAQGVGLGDIDGDGDADLILQYEHDGLTKWQARLSDPDGSRFVYQNGGWETSTGTQFNAKAVGIEDVDGNGYDDLVFQFKHDGLIKWQARLSDGSRFVFQDGAWQTSTGTQSANVVGVADVDGDGKADLILEYEHGGYINWQARLANVDTEVFEYQGTQDWISSTTTQSATAVGVADVDGDGFSDLVISYNAFR